MNHLLISRQYPPAPNSGGGIATYTGQIAAMLASRGEVVHVIGQLWPGAPRPIESRFGEHLTIHRVDPNNRSAAAGPAFDGFAGQAALLAESLIETAGIDIVEAQEYEAPAYPLMVRRSSGLGPQRQVPILTHLHTPTEFVYRLNGWEQNLHDQAVMIELEGLVIRAADALVCPSHFLARIAESNYELEHDTVNVIRYPLGDATLLSRNETVWRDGTIWYAGRLEPRKGVIEWIDAAVAVAQNTPCHFTMIGADTSSPDPGIGSTRAMLIARIPAPLRPMFSFPGEVARRHLPAHLAQARIAVIPSRWENFPYVCIEAMASGLPVLVSPTGGMAEMIEDGRTGWIAEACNAPALAAALRRALATPPPVLAQMGAAAAAAIRNMCDDQSVVRQHLALRRRMIETGCRRASVPTVVKPAATDQGTMTPLDILLSSPQQQLAVARKALADPRYVVRWLAWHGRRVIQNILQRVRRESGRGRA
jgi:glycogen synthase